MSAAGLIVRIMIATITVIALGAIAVFSLVAVEPFYTAFGDPPASLGWGDPAQSTMVFFAAGFIALIMVLVIWFVSAPIRNDRRQGYR